MIRWYEGKTDEEEENILYDLLNSGEKLTEEELEYIAYEDVCIEQIDEGSGRWERYMTSIFQVKDQYWALDWAKGLTENQEDYFYQQPYQVKKIEEVKIVHSWVPVKDAE